MRGSGGGEIFAFRQSFVLALSHRSLIIMNLDCLVRRGSAFAGRSPVPPLTSIILVTVSALVMLTGGCTKDSTVSPGTSGGPMVTSVSPTTVGACDVIEIRGRGLFGSGAPTRVLIGTDTLRIQSLSDTLMRAGVPAGTRSGVLRVIIGR